MMERDVEGRCGAAFGERSPERANSRNGYRDRLWETRAGSVDLKIPKLRQGSYLQRRYLQLEGLQAVGDNQPARLSAVMS